MGIVRNISFLVFFCCISTTISAQFITVDDTYTAQQLVSDVLVNSPCANVENFSVSGDPFSAGQQSYGFFDGNSSIFPFANGVLLSTARAMRSPGPNDNLIDEGSIAWGGDADLEQALGITNTLNATILEFDFTPLTNQISFDYIFASEEYQGTAPCHYSDGFAFLLKPADNSEPYSNLAILPNSHAPVLVTSVHPQIGGGSGCPAQNEEYFGGFNGSGAPINYNGQTVVLTAKSAVTPNVKYHIKLVIADHENIRYDSAIFLGGGSFRVSTDLGPDRLLSTGNPLCLNESYPLDASQPGTNTYKWFKDNVLQPETTATYLVTQPGTYKVQVMLNATSCVSEGQARIEYSSAINTPAVTLVQCDDDNDGITLFNLPQADNLISIGDPSISDIDYYETMSPSDLIITPQQYLSTAKTIFAKVTNAYGCTAFVNVNLQISNNTVPAQNPISTCDGDSDQDGLYHFDLNAEVAPSILSTLPSGIVLEFYPDATSAITQTNPLANVFENTQPFSQIIWARALNGPECYGVIPIELIVNTFSLTAAGGPVPLCSGSEIPLAVASGFSSYLWNDAGGSTGNSIMVNAPGTYTVVVTDSNGCTATAEFIVTLSGVATITDIQVNDFQGDANTVLVTQTGPGNYEYSLDGTAYQDSPLFTNVPSGIYKVYVNDKNHCGLVTRDIFVLDYPKYFTPNGDGFNDVWRVDFLELYPSSLITIFDRFGKLIYAFSGRDPGWDGKLNSRPLPSTDYWFVISLQDQRQIRGHFTLKR